MQEEAPATTTLRGKEAQLITTALMLQTAEGNSSPVHDPRFIKPSRQEEIIQKHQHLNAAIKHQAPACTLHTLVSDNVTAPR